MPQIIISDASLSAFGDVFAGIGVREPQPAASEAFTHFGEAHREIEKYAIQMLKTVKPVSEKTKGDENVGDPLLILSTISLLLLQMISDLNTYLNKAVPDTRLTIKKYLDAKFEYLVCFRDITCIKVTPGLSGTLL